MGKSETLPTIWEIPDDLWEQINPVISEMDPPKPTGRKRVHPRGILDGIIFRRRSGCHWNRLPRELWTTAASTGPSSAGWSLAFWSASGLRWSRSVRKWGA